MLFKWHCRHSLPPRLTLSQTFQRRFLYYLAYMVQIRRIQPIRAKYLSYLCPWLLTLPINLPFLLCAKPSPLSLAIVLIHMLLQGYGSGLVLSLSIYNLVVYYIPPFTSSIKNRGGDVSVDKQKPFSYSGRVEKRFQEIIAINL